MSLLTHLPSCVTFYNHPSEGLNDCVYVSFVPQNLEDLSHRIQEVCVCVCVCVFQCQTTSLLRASGSTQGG